MRSIDDCRKILIAYETQTQKNCAALSRELDIPIRTITDIIKRYTTLANFNAVVLVKPTSYWERKPKSQNVSDEFLAKAVSESFSFRQVMKKCGVKEAGGNYKTFKSRIARLGFDTTHFTGQASNKGKIFEHKETIPLEQIMIEHSAYLNSNGLRKRIIKASLLENVCNECKIKPEWNNKPLTLHLDHINGNHFDHRLENLRLLCPNCHSQTSTYCRKKSALNKNNETI